MRGLRTALLLLTLAVPAFVVPAFAVEPGERLADPVLEARAREIGQGLRCLTGERPAVGGVDSATHRGASDITPDGRFLVLVVEKPLGQLADMLGIGTPMI